MLFLCSVLCVVTFSDLILADPYHFVSNPKAADYVNSFPANFRSLSTNSTTGNFGQINSSLNSKTESKFKTIAEWKQLDFDYDSEIDRQNDIKEKIFIPGQAAPIDVDVYYGRQNRSIFVTIARFRPGIPVTLGTVVFSKSTNLPLIKPYPSWKWHRFPAKCRKDRIVSVYRIKVDSCGRLWVLDTGRLETGQVCPMQILAFDLETNEPVHRKIIPPTVLQENSVLVTPVVEILNDNCLEPFVYIADTVGFSIIVHDAKRGTFWKVSDKTMFPYPNYSSFEILGDTFDLVDGILGMDLGPRIPGQERKLFYHALSSITENWVYTSSLRNQSLYGEYPWVHPKVFNVYEGTRKSQSAAQAIDRNGISFFAELSQHTINCWDTTTEFGRFNIDVVESNKETLQFPSGIKVIDYPRGDQELWILTSRLQKVITGSLQKDEINYRILAAKVEDALFRTKCGKQRSLNNRRCTGSFCG